MLSTLVSGVCFPVKSAFFLMHPMNKLAYFANVLLLNFFIYESFFNKNWTSFGNELSKFQSVFREAQIKILFVTTNYSHLALFKVFLIHIH